jgi:NarL family two-component system sensor histidine kinase YdfH
MQSIRITLSANNCAFGKTDTVRSYNVRTTDGTTINLIYNVITMTTHRTSPISKVERDPRLFLWFMSLVVGLLYVLTLLQRPAVRRWEILIPFSVLLLIHMVLHWQLENIIKRANWIFWYILIQGAFALIISWLGNETGMTFALFMALLGEAVGLLRLTPPGLLAGVYYLILMVVGLARNPTQNSLGPLLVGTIPMVVFVVIYVTLYMRQNEAREQAQVLAAELEKANRQLSEYAAQVEDLTIANERQRLARELHDTLSQGLAGLILQLEAADAHLSNKNHDKAQKIVANAMTQARVTLAEARHAIDDLRQSSPDDLDSALRLEISRFSEATGISILLRADPTPALSDPVKETLMRVVKEALSNIANHANAQNVEINLKMEEQLQLTIRDDGHGFDASAIPAGHYGLLGIKERVRLLNGRFEIQSQTGTGTALSIEIPL